MVKQQDQADGWVPAQVAAMLTPGRTVHQAFAYGWRCSASPMSPYFVFDLPMPGICLAALSAWNNELNRWLCGAPFVALWLALHEVLTWQGRPPVYGAAVWWCCSIWCLLQCMVYVQVATGQRFVGVAAVCGFRRAALDF